MSDVATNIPTNSTRYSVYQSTDGLLSMSSLEEPATSCNCDAVRKHRINRSIGTASPEREDTVITMPQTNKRNKISETNEPVVLLPDLPSKLDVSKIVDKILAKNQISDAYSIIIVVPSSEHNDTESEETCNRLDSITGNQSTESSIAAYNSMEPDPKLRTTSSTKCRDCVCGKGKKFYMQEILSFNDTETMFNNECLPYEVLKHVDQTNNKFCQVIIPNNRGVLETAENIVSTDTTMDRPCCCSPKKSSTTFVIQNNNSLDQYAANVSSRQIIPLFLKGKKPGWFRLPASANTEPCNNCLVATTSDSRHHSRHHRHRATSVRQYAYQPDGTYLEIPQPCVCFPDGSQVTMDKLEIDSMRYKSRKALTKAGHQKSGSKMFSTKNEKGLTCMCKDTSKNKNHRKNKNHHKNKNHCKNKTCTCQERHFTSRTESEPTSASKLRSHHGKPTHEEVSKTSSHSSSKKTRFDGIAKKYKRKSSESTMENETDPEASEDHCVCQDFEDSNVSSQTTSGNALNIKPRKSAGVMAQKTVELEPQPPLQTENLKKGKKPQIQPDQQVRKKKSKDPTNSKISNKISKLFSTIRKISSSKFNYSSNKKILKTDKKGLCCPKDLKCCEKSNSKENNNTKDKNDQKDPKKNIISTTSQDRDVLSKNDEPKSKQKSVTTSDPNSQSTVQPLPISDTKQLLQSQSMSKTEQVPQLPPKSETEQLLQSQPMPESEQVPQSKPISETQQVPQSQPMSDTKSIPLSQQMQEPQQHPQDMLQSEQIPQADLRFPLQEVPEDYPSCGWIDIEAVMKMRSELSLFTSGFKVCKKKKNMQMEQLQEIELDFEDAIKYYASIKPELFRDLMQQEIQKKLDSELEEAMKKGKKYRKKKEKERKKREKAKKKAKKDGKMVESSSEDSDEEKLRNLSKDQPCVCPYGPIPMPISYDDSTLSPEELTVLYPKGLKVNFGGKGSASPGLAGVACFDMIHESYMPW